MTDFDQTQEDRGNETIIRIVNDTFEIDQTFNSDKGMQIKVITYLIPLSASSTSVSSYNQEQTTPYYAYIPLAVGKVSTAYKITNNFKRVLRKAALFTEQRRQVNC